MLIFTRALKVIRTYTSIANYIPRSSYLSLFLCLAFLFFSSIVDLFSVTLLSIGVNTILGNTNMSSFILFPSSYVIPLLVASLVSAPLIRGISLKLSLNLGDNIYLSISQTLFSRLFSYPIEVTDRINSDRFATLVFNNLSRIPELFFFSVQAVSSLLTVVLISSAVIYSGGFSAFFLLSSLVLIASGSSFFSSLLTRGLGYNIATSYENLLRVIRQSISSHRLSFLDDQHRHFQYSEYQSLLKQKRQSQSAELFSTSLSKLLSEPLFYLIILIYCAFTASTSSNNTSLGIVLFGLFKVLPQLWTLSALPPFIASCISQLDQALSLIIFVDSKPLFGVDQSSNIQTADRHDFVIELTSVKYSIPSDDYKLSYLLYPSRKTNFLYLLITY